MGRSVEDWRDILRGLFPQDAAARILADLTGYPLPYSRLGELHHADDVVELAAALTAYESFTDDPTDEAA